MEHLVPQELVKTPENLAAEDTVSCQSSCVQSLFVECFVTEFVNVTTK
jgi:hypothetical protein